VIAPFVDPGNEILPLVLAGLVVVVVELIRLALAPLAVAVVMMVSLLMALPWPQRAAASAGTAD
jgi:hypothetical protein